jgi:hypothetical protein
MQRRAQRDFARASSQPFGCDAIDSMAHTTASFNALTMFAESARGACRQKRHAAEKTFSRAPAESGTRGQFSAAASAFRVKRLAALSICRRENFFRRGARRSAANARTKRRRPTRRRKNLADERKNPAEGRIRVR